MAGSEQFPTYRQNVATRLFRRIPRGRGHSDRFAALFQGSEERDRYIEGLKLLAALFFSFFLVWSFVLLILRYQCKHKTNRFGFLTGDPLQEPPPPKQKQWKRRLKLVRLIFVLSGVTAIVCAAFSLVLGVEDLFSGVETLRVSNQQMKQLTLEGGTLTLDLLRQANAALATRDAILEEPAAYCLDESLYPAGVDLGSVPSVVLDSLQAIGDFRQGFLNILFLTFADVYLITVDGDATIDDILALEDLLRLLIAYVFIPLTVLLLIGGVWACFERLPRYYACFLDYVVLRVFSLVMVVVYTLGAVFFMASVANADFCSGGSQSSPGGTILDIMVAEDWEPSDLAFQAFNQYIGQCGEEQQSPFLPLLENRDELAAAIETLRGFFESMEDANLDLTGICGANATILEALLQILQQSLIAALAVLRLVSCSRVVPIIANALFRGTCESQVRGFSWMFLWFTVMCFSGMLMLTFRAAYRSPMYYESSEHGDVGPFVEELLVSGDKKREGTSDCEPYQSHPSNEVAE